MGKINKNSKRQLKLKIKKLQGDIDTLWAMVTSREQLLKEKGLLLGFGVEDDGFITGVEESLEVFLPRGKTCQGAQKRLYQSLKARL